MKALRPQITAVTDRLIDDFIAEGTGDLAQVAWRQPGIVLFTYLLGMPADDVSVCFELTDTALNGAAEDARMHAWTQLYQHIHDTVTARAGQPPRDDMIDVLLNAEIDGERLPLPDVVSNAMLLVQAGLETTASALSFALHHLAVQPAQRDLLIAEPELLPRAVEELIRYAGSIHGLHRDRGPRTSNSTATPSAPGTPWWSTSPPRTGTRTSSPMPTAASSTAARTATSASVPAYTGASGPIWRAWSSRSRSNESWRGYPTTRSTPQRQAVFHGNSITRGFRCLPVVFTPGAPRPA